MSRGSRTVAGQRVRFSQKTKLSKNGLSTFPNWGDWAIKRSHFPPKVFKTERREGARGRGSEGRGRHWQQNTPLNHIIFLKVELEKK